MATAIYNPKAEITAMGKAQAKAEQIGLQTAQQKSLAELTKTKSEIAPEYLKKRNTVDINSQVAAKNFQEYLAQRGQNTGTGLSGTSAQAALTTGAMRQGGLSNLAAGEAAANTENTRQVGATNVAYQQGLAQSNATVGATVMQSLISAQQAYNTQKIAQENTDRAFKAQQAQQAADNLFRKQQAAEATRQAALNRAASRSSGGSGGGGGGGGSTAKEVNTNSASNTMLTRMDDIVESREDNFKDRLYMIEALAREVSRQGGTQAKFLQNAAATAREEIRTQEQDWKDWNMNIKRGR